VRKIKVGGRRLKLPTPSSPFWHLHAHSHFSDGDALPTPQQMVDTVTTLGQKALALTDHGNMAGAVQLYQACKKAGIAPFPGEEFYFKREAKDPKQKRYHVGLVAFTTEGYESLVRLSSRSHTRPWFHNKPHVGFSDFAEWHERGMTRGLALTTGCYFGMVQQTLIEQGYENARYLVQMLSNWFPNTYVELQHHNIDHEGEVTDDEIIYHLTGIADDLGLPTVITQDAHYCTIDDRPQHETMKRLVSWGDDPDDAVFPGDGFHLADYRFVKSHYRDADWSAAMDGLTDLYSRHTLVIPELETYHYNVPVVTAGDPLSELAGDCTEMLAEMVGTGRISSSQEDAYYDRFAEEYDVVKATNMAGYMMLNKMICDWMDEQAIFHEARGSASGSLICYLLGITQEDPVAGGLRYERFLSKDRTKPPDIDLDVEDSRRGEVLNFLDERFNVCQIGTWAQYGLNKETGGGSLFVSYLSKLRKEGVSPAKIASIKSIHEMPDDDRRELEALDRHEAFKSYGTHAGGLVITSTKDDFDRLVPTMLVASSNTKVTQFEMDDVEALGLLKEDILGQISLTTMRRCTELLGRDPKEGWSWIPLDDKKTFRAIRQQQVDGVFQLEGWTCKKGCREMRPKRIMDLIHLVALYRPATMETGMKDAYIQRMAGWEAVPQRHEILTGALKETYGVPVFQDQVIVVLREIGFTPEDLTNFLKAVKASNENIGNAAKVIEGYKGMFGDLATQAGFSQSDLVFTWEAIQGFAKYGFNKAHATTYGKRSYRMAYMKTHHALEFHAALLQTWAGRQKERDYIIATKDAGIKMLGPDVNVSGALWSIDRQRGAIRKGLLSVKGVGEKAADEIAANSPYTSMEDLIARCDGRKVTGGKSYSKDGSLNGILGKLKDVRALRSIGE
jgi:DNA polymerase III subunit alpha